MSSALVQKTLTQSLDLASRIDDDTMIVLIPDVGTQMVRATGSYRASVAEQVLRVAAVLGGPKSKYALADYSDDDSAHCCACNSYHGVVQRCRVCSLGWHAECVSALLGHMEGRLSQPHNVVHVTRKKWLRLCLRVCCIVKVARPRVSARNNTIK